MTERSCLYASGGELAKKLATERVSTLEEALILLKKKGREYLDVEYSCSGEEAVVALRRSVFWNIVKGSSIEKVKKAGCRSENDFIRVFLEETLGKKLSIEKLSCMVSEEKCRFRIKCKVDNQC